MATLGLLLIILLSVLLWQHGMRSRDLAIRTAREVCRSRGVQFLDGTAALERIRPVFDKRNGPGLQRIYSFDYSVDGIGRQRGSIIMHNATVASVLLHD
ncbi:MAG: DUF3301 domain-containing protein [Thiohalobacterales bacterium]|nr:DUF3301 domain-containing protein [Thiohalobacterales bacterium]